MAKIEVRSLTGESTTVSVSRDKTVDYLKRLLVLDFPPASTSANFHLFFKGVRLSVNSPLSTLEIQDGEFLALIPFVKKERKPPAKPDSVLNVLPQQSPVSGFPKGAAYSDMMKGLSSLVGESIKARQGRGCTAGNDIFSGSKRKWNSGRYDEKLKEELLNEILGSVNRPKSTRTSWTSSTRRKPCREKNQLLPMEMIQHLQKGMASDGQIVHVEPIRARKAQFVDIPTELSTNTKSVLSSMGINKLYSHQAESIIASLMGKNVVVATMTSSGKSLCYNVPVLEVLSKNLLSCALYLFPTKALAQDQLRALLTMTQAYDTSINIGVYDGDTCQNDRKLLRSSARLLITNPDMLHMSILPHHGQFRRFLANLRFVIIDEAHTYKGAFGCHTSLVLRRLRRICSHVYGSDPSFIFSTATSANPREHCMELANLSTLELIKNDGSPSAEKLFVLWNPPASVLQNDSETATDVECSGDKYMSPVSTVSYLLSEMVQHGLRCIAFCRSRKLTELVLSYTREILQETAPNLVDKISSYRGGYVPEERRKIEKDFFSGKLSGIAATNALELGIDVGHIDATLHLGFPGSIASLWQQAGRSGRRERTSLAVYVAFEEALDQYFMKYPRKLFDSPIECCYVDSQNAQVVEQHLACAAFEYPLSLQYDENHFGPELSTAVMSLKNKGVVTCNLTRDSSARIWNYIGREKMPSRGVGIRNIENIRYRVIDTQGKKLLEEIEESKAFFQVHEGAIYMHQGMSYLVKELDISEKIAWCQPIHVNYYTKTLDFSEVQILGGDAAYPVRAYDQSRRTTAQTHPCKVTTSWMEYSHVARGSNKVLDTFELRLPSYSYESQAAWIEVPQSFIETMKGTDFGFTEGLHAASHALLSVVPLYVRCDYSDLAPECPKLEGSGYRPPRILVYDQHIGGTGVSKQVQPYFTELLNAALELITACHCVGNTGCPKCVQLAGCRSYNDMIHKQAAIMLITGILEAERSFFEELDKSSSHPPESK